MKIKCENQLGLVFREKNPFKELITEAHLDPAKNPVIWTQQDIDFRKNILNEFFDDLRFKDYLITRKVQEISTKVKIGQDFNFKLLNTIPDQNSSYLIDSGRFFRFMVKNNNIYVFYLQYNKDAEWMDYEMFRIDTVAGQLLNVSERAYDLAQELIRYIIFVNLSEVDYKILPAGRKVGTRLTGFKNDTKYPVTIVDSDWNKFVIRAEGFSVSGHLRLQPCGPGFSQRKLVWVNGYEKSGYIRTPKNVL